MSPREIFALRDYLDPGLKGRTLSGECPSTIAPIPQ